jgi:hypothetical protein
MGFVIEGFIGLALLLGAAWMVLFLRTKREDDARRADEARESQVERFLRTPGERLYCVACQHAFEGPLPEDGCPLCRCGSFVVPERLRPGGAENTGTTVAAPSMPREEKEPAPGVMRAKQGGGPGA